MKRRAEQCIKDIEATMQSEPIAAAARMLVHRKQPKAAEALSTSCRRSTPIHFWRKRFFRAWAV